VRAGQCDRTCNLLTGSIHSPIGFKTTLVSSVVFMNYTRFESSFYELLGVHQLKQKKQGLLSLLKMENLPGAR
jgi:hypothetical protein